MPPSWNLLSNVFGRIRVSTQNMSTFLIDPFVQSEALVRANAQQILLDSGWLSEQCHQVCQESAEIWKRALI